ncbi:ABC transporter permease [Candidatus Woesearchaeota archaeon]|nr:ABC transporter permease [Candidatus Woesearchaeota archaeon]
MNILDEVMELVKKNAQNLIRSKAGSLVVILGPLLIIFLAGLAFDNSNVYAVKVGIYRPDNASVTARFTEQLKDQFKVQEFASELECIDAVRNTDTAVCMRFAENFSIGVPTKNQVTFYIDYSRINLVWAVRKAMSEKVDEASLQASENLTSNLLGVIEFTKKEVQKERDALIRLTTQNELVNKNTQDLLAELGDIDLSVETEFSLDNVTSAGTQVKQWADSSLELGERSLNKAAQFMGAANDVLKSSGASSQAKDSLLASLQANLKEMDKLKADMVQMRNLTKDAFARFDAQMSALTLGIVSTKAKLDEADTSRQLSIRVIESVRLLLDQSLLSVFELQKSLNDIDNKISSIEITDANAIAQPIVTNIKPVVQEKTYLNYLFPILIVLVIMFTGLLITPTLILLDKKSPASFRTYMTPVRDISYVIANFITAFLILVVQTAIVLAIVSAFFSISVQSLPFTMIVGYVFESEETATLAGVSIGALFLFVSDVIIPLESMPEMFAYIASFNPYVLGSSLIRRAMIFNSPLSSMLQDTAILFGYVFAFAFIAMGVFLLTKRYSLQELAKALAPVWDKVHLPHRKK